MRWFLILLLTALPVAAEPLYELDAPASSVSFIVRAGGFEIDGRMPVIRADTRIDLGRVAASKIDVTVSTRQVRTGIILATNAIKEDSVLNPAAFPEMRFQATRISRNGNAATVEGTLTARGVTRPLTLEASFFRTPDMDPEDLTRIGVRLTGTTNRFDFGISGYPNFAEPTVTIDIRAWMDRLDD